MKALTLRLACCERFGWSPDDFEESMLWHCLHRRGLPAAKVLWHFKRPYFASDLELLRTVADCTTCSEVRAELDTFCYHQPNHGFLRKRLRIRLSGQRLVDTAAKLLG